MQIFMKCGTHRYTPKTVQNTYFEFYKLIFTSFQTISKHI